jgi:hypothetical protein
LADAIKMYPYSKYMKNIVFSKRNIPNKSISILCLLIIHLKLNYQQKSKEIEEFLLYHAPLKNMLDMLYVIMPCSLYNKLDLDKLVPS